MARQACLLEDYVTRELLSYQQYRSGITQFLLHLTKRRIIWIWAWDDHCQTSSRTTHIKGQLQSDPTLNRYTGDVVMALSTQDANKAIGRLCG